MSCYLHTVLYKNHRRVPLKSTAPLFLDSLNQPFSRQQFIYYLREILQTLRYKNDYCGHSIRISAASTVVAVGIEDHLIKELGRWNSSCYE